uniref:Protein FAR1-RELATED SEQUENCE n=1 Tax=Nicotiana tabacum TaxID=4097 RepID=A0A1S3Z383_TOBAC|nr:PREDICTED: uncharacterized protein LOC107782522 [Nicotiana tabacum]
MGEGITFISDMQKGLIDSISEVLPEAHHRFCVRHIEANWCKRWGSGEYKKYLWWVAWSTYEEDFQDQLKSMSQVDDDGKTDVENLLKYPLTCWSRAFFDTTCKNQSVDNNLTESFNAWILQAGYKPIIKMLEEIRIKIMNMLTDNEAEVVGWGSEYSPKTLNLYNQFMRIAQKCHVNGSDDQGYEETEVKRRLPTSNECPDFEIPNFEPEPDIAIRPKSISEARTRLQLRQQSVPVATRQIGFVGDSSGVSHPSKLTFSAKGITWLGNSAITGNQLNKQRLTKLQAIKDSGKEQK